MSLSFAGFIGNNPTAHNFIRDVRLLLKGKNVSVRIFARNKNRKQYAKNAYEVRCFRQNLPLKHATHYGVYIYKDRKKNVPYDANRIHDAKVVFETVKKIYDLNGAKIFVGN